MKNEHEARALYVSKALSYLGAVQGDKRHKEIIDTYNTLSPLPRGYKMLYSDAWCATFVSAIGIMVGWKDIILPECSCTKMIDLYMESKTGLWMERDSYVPEVGDIIMYNWSDGSDFAVMDNTAPPNHTGIVAEVSASNFTVVEGNKNNSVAKRVVKYNGQYIRGFCLPYFKAKVAPEAPPAVPPAAPPPGPSVWASDAVKWAAESGVSDCTRLQEPMTREEGITMLHRVYRMMGEQMVNH